MLKLDLDSMKSLVKRALRKRGFEVRRIGSFAHKTVGDFLASRQVSVVIDVGANRGQFGRMIRDLGYTGKIVSFEPIREVFDQLSTRARSDPLWEAHNYALGAENGSADISVCANTTFSSLLDQTEAAQIFDRGATITRTERIEIKTLDSIAEALPEGIVFLKVDTQGYEQRVLAGARRFLPSLCGVLLELPIVHLYANDWQLHEAIKFMHDQGFRVSNFWPVNHDPHDDVSLIEIDCLFKPDDPAVFITPPRRDRTSQQETAFMR